MHGQNHIKFVVFCLFREPPVLWFLQAVSMPLANILFLISLHYVHVKNLCLKNDSEDY